MVTFSADGTRILAAMLCNNEAFVLDAQTGEKVLTLDGHTAIVPGVSFSADGTRLATVSHDGTAKIWDVNTGLLLLTLYGPAQGINRGIFSPDGRYFATQNEDGTTRIFYLSIEDTLALAKSRLTRPLKTVECQRYLHMDACPPES